MKDIQKEYASRFSVLSGANHDELFHRLSGLIKWMESEPVVNAEIEKLKSKVNLDSILKQDETPYHGRRRPPTATSLEEIAMIGWAIMDACREGHSIHQVAHTFALSHASNLNDIAYELLQKYVNPFLSYIQEALPESHFNVDGSNTLSGPPIILESLEKFRSDYPDSKKTGFLMMKFGTTPAHTAITEVVRTTLTKYGLKAVRADDKEYHEDLFPNVQTYMHGCGFGIAVMERIEAEEFNPNVSLEIGYMLAHRKPVLLLKDSTLKQLHADLVGKLYRPFDFQKPEESIPKQLKSWLEDKGLI
jgi:hypothetical protein